MTPETSLGFSAVEFAVDVVGLTPLPWQRWSLIHGLELLPDRRYRFRTLLILVARQNGKTSEVEVKNLWKMFVQGAQVLGTAQDLDVSEESWDNAVEICEGIPDLAAEVTDVIRVNGKKALKLRNGARWKVKAANRRGGRGFSGDDVNLDELREHQNWNAWGAVTKTTLARGNAQIWAFTNAGDDSSVVLNDLQGNARATAGEGTVPADLTLGLQEWSVPDDVDCTCGRVNSQHAARCRLQDRDLWAVANPALGYTITEGALASALATDPTEVFLTECLCKRVPKLAPAVITGPVWQLRGGLEVADRPAGAVAFALDAAWPDAEQAAIAVAGRRGDELLVQVVDHRPGTGWLVDRVVELRDRHRPCAIVLDPASPAAREKAALEAAGVELVLPTTREVAQAAGALYTAVTGDEPSLRHYGQPELDAAVAGAKKRPLGDAWTWARQGSADISPLVAVTLAAWGHTTRGHLTETKPLVAFA